MSANDIIQRNAECARQLLDAGAEIERLRAELKWISEQRWNEDADLDDICTRADRALQPQETDR